MRLKVLLADSSGLLKEVLSFSMAEKQIEFVAVETGTDALLQVKELFPDVLLADVALPGVDGYNLCEMVKSDNELNSKVILLYDSITPLDDDRAKACGSDEALKKPFNADILFDLFQEWGFESVPEEGGSVSEVVEDAGEALISEEIAPEETDAEIAEAKDLPLEVKMAEMPKPSVEEKPALFEVEGESRFEDDDSAPDPFNPEEVFEVSDRDTLLESTEGILTSAISENKQVNLGDEDDSADYQLHQNGADSDLSGSMGKELLQEIVKNLSDDVVREVAWEVVPDLAERMIREAIGKITKR